MRRVSLLIACVALVGCHSASWLHAAPRAHRVDRSIVAQGHTVWSATACHPMPLASDGTYLVELPPGHYTYERAGRACDNVCSVSCATVSIPCFGINSDNTSAVHVAECKMHGPVATYELDLRQPGEAHVGNLTVRVVDENASVAGL